MKEFPFTLGRGDHCDYKIPSHRVSREHAEIQRGAGGYVIHDLQSTNGTLVNGQSVEKAHLEDGDLILIADVELTFRAAWEAEPHQMVTQVMPGDQAGEERQESETLETIHAVRAWHERLLSRGLRSHFNVLVDLASGRTAGYESIPARTSGREQLQASERLLEETDCRLTERMHQLERLLATEQAAQLPQAELLFLRLQPAEVGADFIPASLARMQSGSRSKRIVAAIPESTVADIPYFRDFLARLRNLGVGVAYSGSAGNQQQMLFHPEFAPGFLMLAPLLARGVDKSTQRQQQIRTIVEAARQSNTRVVATGVHSQVEAQTCRELGCQLALGEHYGHVLAGENASDDSRS